jgi:hypothetical protein
MYQGTHIDFLTLDRMLALKGDLQPLIKQLTLLPCPDTFRIGWGLYDVPKSLNEFRDNICWGQRLMMLEPHTSDLDTFRLFVANFYQPFVTGKKFDDGLVKKVAKKLAKCSVKELYPVSLRLIDLFNQTLKVESEKLNSEPDSVMKAAEVDKLKVFSDMVILKIISDKCKVKLSKAHLVDYNTVFALLWEDKEVNDYTKRYQKLMELKHGK